MYGYVYRVKEFQFLPKPEDSSNIIHAGYAPYPRTGVNRIRGGSSSSSGQVDASFAGAALNVTDLIRFLQHAHAECTSPFRTAFNGLPPLQLRPASLRLAGFRSGVGPSGFH